MAEPPLIVEFHDPLEGFEPSAPPSSRPPRRPPGARPPPAPPRRGAPAVAPAGPADDAEARETLRRLHAEVFDFSHSDLTGQKKHRYQMSKLGVAVKTEIRRPLKMLVGIRRERKRTNHRERRAAKRSGVVLPTAPKLKRRPQRADEDPFSDDRVKIREGSLQVRVAPKRPRRS